MVVGLGAVAAVRFLYDVGARSLRNFVVYFAIAFAILVGVALTSKDYEVRCRDNPLEFCIYNDGVPAMATIVLVYTGAAGYRSWNLYDHR